LIDIHTFFAIAAIAMSIGRYGTYFYTIHQGKTKPHAFSWLLWGVVTGIGTVAQFSLNAGPSAYALGFVSITCLLIALLAYFIGTKDYTKSDWFALFACVCAIPVWQITQSPMAALAIIIVIDGLSYWPTIRKSFHHPETEPPISYLMAGTRYFLMLFAIPEPTWSNMLYPFFLMMTDWIYALFLIIRRKQLGFPVHEYKT
jgi:hypothetical protein